MKGIVISNTGSRYEVLLDQGGIVTAAAKGNLRIKGIRTTNPVAVGDRVEVTPTQNSDILFITEIEPRKNYIIRRASNLSKESHILASNIDQALLICSLTRPQTSTTFIDRFLATAEAYSVPAIIVINKIDLLTEENDKALLNAVKTLYETIGYKVILTSTVTEKGITDLKAMVSGKTSLLSGNSGVGKSSIINCLIPGADVSIAEISKSHETGMHTTTFSRMYALPEGGWLIDTPGVRGFGTLDFDKYEVSHFFPEIFKTGQECRFSDCIHKAGEPGCAVLDAVRNHQISESRYASYLSILENDVAGNGSKYR